MVFAINMMHGRGPSNKMHPQLQPKKGKAELVDNIVAKGIIRVVHY